MPQPGNLPGRKNLPVTKTGRQPKPSEPTGANGKPESVEGAGSGEAIGWSFPGARPIRTRKEERGSQWTAPPGAGAERQGNAVTAVNTHVEVC